MSLKDDCKCGHDRTHHYRDPNTGERCNCLAMRCECRWFKDPEQKDPPTPEWAVHKARWGTTDTVDDDKAPETDPLPWAYWVDQLAAKGSSVPFRFSEPKKAKPHADTTCTCNDCNEWTAKRWGGRAAP